jgi:hypothetical protein
VHSLDAPRPAVARERMPSRAPMAVVGATALAPARAPNPVPAVRPALRLVAAAPPEPEPLPEPAFEPERLPDFARARWETCRIRIWRGYVTWQLVAESSSTGSAIALSPTFRARRAKGEPTRAPTLNAAARSAFQRLQELLESDGWERVDDGAAWYEGRFRRRA